MPDKVCVDDAAEVDSSGKGFKLADPLKAATRVAVRWEEAEVRA
jgi:hypothetical protein